MLVLEEILKVYDLVTGVHGQFWMQIDDIFFIDSYNPYQVSRVLLSIKGVTDD